jgi:hypothetical protein
MSKSCRQAEPCITHAGVVRLYHSHSWLLASSCKSELSIRSAAALFSAAAFEIPDSGTRRLGGIRDYIRQCVCSAGTRRSIADTDI